MNAPKINQELAYYKLLTLANEMHNGLQLARNQKDHAPKFQAQVEATIASLIERFDALKPSLPESDGPRYHYDSDGNHLRIYSPGDGGMKFTWLDEANNATGLRVSYHDAAAALALPRNQHLRGVLAETSTGPELLPYVQRVGEYMLKIDDTIYKYEFDNPSAGQPWTTAKFTFHATPYLPQTGMPVQGADVIQQLKKFLSYEHQYYMPSVVMGEQLIDSSTGREAVVMGVSEGSVSITDSDDSHDAMYPQQLFERYTVPRLAAEVAETIRLHTDEWKAMRSVKPVDTAVPDNTSPAP